MHEEPGVDVVAHVLVDLVAAGRVPPEDDCERERASRPGTSGVGGWSWRARFGFRRSARRRSRRRGARTPPARVVMPAMCCPSGTSQISFGSRAAVVEAAVRLRLRAALALLAVDEEHGVRRDLRHLALQARRRQVVREQRGRERDVASGRSLVRELPVRDSVATDCPLAPSETMAAKSSEPPRLGSASRRRRRGRCRRFALGRHPGGCGDMPRQRAGLARRASRRCSDRPRSRPRRDGRRAGRRSRGGRACASCFCGPERPGKAMTVAPFREGTNQPASLVRRSS